MYASPCGGCQSAWISRGLVFQLSNKTETWGYGLIDVSSVLSASGIDEHVEWLAAN